jgi:hypothetical protein
MAMFALQYTNRRQQTIAIHAHHNTTITHQKRNHKSIRWHRNHDDLYHLNHYSQPIIRFHLAQDKVRIFPKINRQTSFEENVLASYKILN